MGLFNWFSGWFGGGSSLFDEDSPGGGSSFDYSGPSINPASGLPMMGDSMIDVAGNPYGTDSNDSASVFNDDPTSTFSDSSFDDNNSSFNSSFDDGASSFSSFNDDSSSSDFGSFGGGGFSDDNF